MPENKDQSLFPNDLSFLSRLEVSIIEDMAKTKQKPSPAAEDTDPKSEKKPVLKPLTPQRIETIVKGATYRVPLFQVTNEGLVEFDYPRTIEFCKGDKNDPGKLRLVGFFTETLLAVCREYLQDVNQGELQSRETAVAITKIDEAILWLGKRAADRQARGVQGTYNK